MTDPRPRSQPGDDIANHYEEGPKFRLGRWLKLAAIIAAVLALLLVIMVLVGGGEHGPSRHF